MLGGPQIARDLLVDDRLAVGRQVGKYTTHKPFIPPAQPSNLQFQPFPVNQPITSMPQEAKSRSKDRPLHRLRA